MSFSTFKFELQIWYYNSYNSENQNILFRKKTIFSSVFNNLWTNAYFKAVFCIC